MNEAEQALQQLPNNRAAITRALWQLGGPVALQAVLSALLVFVDVLMVSVLGPEAVAGVGLANRLLFVVTMVLAGIASGTGVLVAQFAGAGRRRAVRAPVSAALLLGVVLTLPLALAALLAPQQLAGWLTQDPAVVEVTATFLFWSASYGPLTALALTLGSTVRSLGNTRAPMWAGIAALILNTVLNFLFISGRFGLPELGVAAAAGATCLARALEVILLLSQIGPRLQPRLQSATTRLVLLSSMPLMLKEIFWAGGIFASSVIIARMDTLSLAAFNLVSPVEGIVISAFTGCGVASAIMLGHALGRRALQQAYDAAGQLRVLVSRWALCLGLVLALLVQLLRQLELLLPWIDPRLHDLALDSLTVLCLAIGARAHNMMVSLGILRSGNDLRWLMLVDACSMWLINVPLVAVAALVLHWPLPAVVAVMMLEELLKVGLFRWRVKSGRWLNVINS